MAPAAHHSCFVHVCAAELGPDCCCCCCCRMCHRMGAGRLQRLGQHREPAAVHANGVIGVGGGCHVDEACSHAPGGRQGASDTRIAPLQCQATNQLGLDSRIAACWREAC